jgi:hypothetical protein
MMSFNRNESLTANQPTPTEAYFLYMRALEENLFKGNTGIIPPYFQLNIKSSAARDYIKNGAEVVSAADKYFVAKISAENQGDSSTISKNDAENLSQLEQEAKKAAKNVTTGLFEQPKTAGSEQEVSKPSCTL